MADAETVCNGSGKHPPSCMRKHDAASGHFGVVSACCQRPRLGHQHVALFCFIAHLSVRTCPILYQNKLKLLQKPKKKAHLLQEGHCRSAIENNDLWAFIGKTRYFVVKQSENGT